jgi:hypothetical protein
MVKLSFTLEDLDDLPFGIALPIREALRICQMNPPSAWPLAAYELLGRKDLAKMAVLEETDPVPVKVRSRSYCSTGGIEVQLRRTKRMNRVLWNLSKVRLLSKRPLKQPRGQR